MQTKINILVTAIGGGGHGEQILKALLLAKNSKYRIIGADNNPSCAQFGLVEEHIILPRATDSNYLEVLLASCRKYSVNVLFHGCEPELRMISQNRDVIEAEGVFLPMNSAEFIGNFMDKEKTFKILKSHGISVPKFARFSDASGLEEWDTFPVVMKPILGGGGSADVFIAQSHEELLALAQYLSLGVSAGNFLLQEYVGRPDQEYTVGVLNDMNQSYINAIALQRHLSGQMNIRTKVPNRTSNKSLGDMLVISSGISHGSFVKSQNVLQQCRDIAKKIGARSAINIQCRVVDGVVQIFEINPRFSGTTSLRAMVGYNEPDILIRKHVLGEEVMKDFDYREATIIRSLKETVL